MDLITKYKLELSEDTKLDELNLKEKQLMLPNIKHKWVSRLMNAKHDFIKYKAEYKKSIETIIDEIKIELQDASGNQKTIIIKVK